MAIQKLQKISSASIIPGVRLSLRRHKYYLTNHEYYIKNKEKITQRIKKWQEDNPEKVRRIKARARMRYREKHPEKVRITHQDRVCPLCNELFRVSTSDYKGRSTSFSRMRRFCSRKCKNKRLAEVNLIAPQPRPCAYCSKSFLVSGKKASDKLPPIEQIYCSRRCSQRSRNPSGKWNSRGYVVVAFPECCDLHKGMKFRQEHMIIAEHVLGRLLNWKHKEVIHHINGNRSDNRHLNFLICDASYHRQLHHKMSELYQKGHFS